MPSNDLVNTAENYLHALCTEIANRCVGSVGNQQATDLFTEKMIQFGFRTVRSEFDCIDWSSGEPSLSVNGESYEAFVSPYSLGCEVKSPLSMATTIDELKKLAGSDRVLLLRGDIAKEQLMPKNFTFYNPEEHQLIIALLESKKPSAIISATSRNPELAGGIYPFPLIEDGDFDIPSVYMTEKIGDKLSQQLGKLVNLRFEAQRVPSTGCNVIARKGSDPNGRIVIFSHIDAKMGTPGALDNASGVVVLLLLAELLQANQPAITIEIVALNGEDYYSAPGEMRYLADNPNQLQDVYLGINLDGAGYVDGDTAYSLYDCPLEIAEKIRDSFPARQGFIEGEQWYQSDHSLFLMHNRPALAITSEKFDYLSTFITHTEKDSPELADPEKLVDAAHALQKLLFTLDQVWVNSR